MPNIREKELDQVASSPDVYSPVLSPVVFRRIIKASKGVSHVSYIKVIVAVFFLIKDAVSEMEVSRHT